MNAAIGRIQLRRLDEWNERRRSNAKLYDGYLSDIKAIKLPPSGEFVIDPVYHLYVIRTERRDSLKDWLGQNGIQCGVHYPLPIHLQPIYREMFGYHAGEFPQAEMHCQEALSLPMYPDLASSEIRFISDKIRERLG